MKYADMKVGMRVIVTHHSSRDKGKIGVIVSLNSYISYSYAMVKLNDGTEREFHSGSINPAPDVKPAPKEPESDSKPLTADDIVVGTELIYKGGMAPSRRVKGDVYVVTRVFFDNGIKHVKYKYKSGHKPLGFQETGVLLASDVLKFWEIAL